MTLDKILVFGNPLVRRDSIPLKLIDNLRNEFPNIEFKEFDSIEEIQNEGDTLYILDSVEKIKKVMVINDLDKLATDKVYSVHDFDLATNLKILKKIGVMKKIFYIIFHLNLILCCWYYKVGKLYFSFSVKFNHMIQCTTRSLYYSNSFTFSCFNFWCLLRVKFIFFKNLNCMIYTM